MEKAQDKIEIIYDGECPICQAGVKSLCTGEDLGRITKIDKRVETDNAVVQEAKDANLNINKGVIIKYQGKLYQGLDALHLASKLKIGKGAVNAIGRLMFRNKTIGRALYPILRGTRNVLVSLKGVGQIKE